MTYLLINRMTTLPGRRPEVIDLLLRAGAAFDDNAHCLLYLVSEDAEDETGIWVQDVWTDEPSHAEAMADEAMTRWISEAMPLLAGAAEQFRIRGVGGKHPFENV